MIVYANNHMSCDISCATNLSLITDEQIVCLSKTRLKFNIQFPFVSDNSFAKVQEPENSTRFLTE